MSGSTTPKLNGSPKASPLRGLSKIKLLRLKSFATRNSSPDKSTISSPTPVSQELGALTLAPPRSPEKALRVLGIDSAPPATAAEPAIAHSRTQRGRLLSVMAHKRPHTGPVDGTFAAQQLALPRLGRNLSDDGGAYNASTPRVHASARQSSDPASQHSLARMTSYFDFVPMTTTPAPELPHALRPSSSLPRLSLDSSAGSSEFDSHLAEALFTTSISAAHLSEFSRKHDPISTRASSVDGFVDGDSQVWPPPGLVSRFSDATTTVANSTTISLVDTADLGHMPDPGGYNISLREYHLGAMEHLRGLEHRIDRKQVPTEDKVAEWYSQYQAETVSSRNDTPAPSTAYESVQDEDLLADIADLYTTHTLRRTSSLPSLVGSESSGSVSSSYRFAQSPNLTCTPIDGARLRPLKGTARDDHWKRRGWIGGSNSPGEDAFAEGLGLYMN